jgi:hypothetical protein
VKCIAGYEELHSVTFAQVRSHHHAFSFHEQPFQACFLMVIGSEQSCERLLSCGKATGSRVATEGMEPAGAAWLALVGGLPAGTAWPQYFNVADLRDLVSG